MNAGHVLVVYLGVGAVFPVGALALTGLRQGLVEWAEAEEASTVALTLVLIMILWPLVLAVVLVEVFDE